MKTLFDTSVLIAAIVQAHPKHYQALPWLKKAKEKKLEYLVAAHTLAELYAVLTTLPVSPKIKPGLAQHLIQENVVSMAKIIPLSPSEYSATIQQTANLCLSGGKIYDALIAAAAQKAKAQKLLTLNRKDFQWVWPEGSSLLHVP